VCGHGRARGALTALVFALYNPAMTTVVLLRQVPRRPRLNLLPSLSRSTSTLPRTPPCSYVSSRTSSTSSCTAERHQVLEDFLFRRTCEPGRVPRFVSPPGTLSLGCLPQDQLPVSISVCVQFHQKQKQLRGNLNITCSFLFYSNPISIPIGSFLVRLHQILCSNSNSGKTSPFYFVPPCPDR
jgi:hypothetical protein